MNIFRKQSKQIELVQGRRKKKKFAESLSYFIAARRSLFFFSTKWQSKIVKTISTLTKSTDMILEPSKIDIHLVALSL
jgi:hypothetical protein